VATEEQTQYDVADGYIIVGSGDYDRAGQRLTISSRTVTKLGFWLRKYGTPPGSYYFAIRKVSDDSIIVREAVDSADNLTETITYIEHTFASPPTINEEVRILVEYNLGDASNMITTYRKMDDVKADEYSIYHSALGGYEGSSQAYDHAYRYTYTAATAPTVTTQAVTDITTTTATGNGNITSVGAPAATQHGVCWNTGGTPTIDDDKTEEGVPSTGAFTSSITGLIAGTKYYVRAYVTNALGTSYGNEVYFTAYSHSYPVDAITRVTNLTHRYNRATGEYNLIMALGEVTTDFGIPTVDRTPVSSSVQDQPKEEAKAVVEQAQDEGILPPPKPRPKPTPPAPPPAPPIPSYTAGTPVVVPAPKPTPEPATLTEYAKEVIRKQPYRAAAITQQVKKVPSRPTVYAYDVLAEQERRAQELEERQAAARLATGRIATERTKAIITSSPEAQRRLKEIEEQRKSWWEFWK